MFLLGTAAAMNCSRRLGRAGGANVGEVGLGRAPSADKGELPMQNALLVGLSRQVALGRELDVVANNIANINTTGYKADGSVFEEFSSDRARRQRHGRRQPRQLRAATARTWHDLSQGTIETNRQSARRRDRRQRLPRGADAARRALHPQRRAADQRQRRAGHQRRRSGAGRSRPDHLSAERP